MRRVWVNVLNKIINAKDTITLSAKLSRTSMVIDIGNYKNVIKRFPHLDTLKSFIERLSDAGCVIDEIHNNLEGNALTEEYIYLIKKPNELMAEAQSKFLYELDKIEPECIDYEYTGNLIPKEISGIVQKLIMHTENRIFTVDISGINSQNFGVINIRKDIKHSLCVPESITLLYDRYSKDTDVLIKHELEKQKYKLELIEKILVLIKLYRPYM